MQPIWKNCIIDWTDTAGEAEPVVFAVEIAGAEVYRGKLLCMDGRYTFDLSEIVADELWQAFPDCLRSGRASYPAALTAETVDGVRRGVFVRGWYASNEGGATDFTASPVFLYDWSYTEAEDPGAAPAVDASFLRSDPIDGVLHPLQYIILTAFDDLAVTVRIKRPAGGSDFNADFGPDFGGGGDVTRAYALLMKTNTVLPPLSWPAGEVSATVDGEDGALALSMPDCLQARYVLHYVNAFGGWDSFVPQGLARVTDGATRREYTRRAVNVNAAGGWQPRRGRTVYGVDVARHYELNTHWLTEEQAARMHHLTESPDIWLFDTREARFIPVVCTNAETERKTHAGEGGHLISYSLTFEEAVNRNRR